MSPGNLYYHYRNKEDIVRGLFERLSAEWRVLYTLPEDRGPTLTDLDGMLRGHFQALWRYRFFYREMVALTQRDPGLRARYRGERDRGYENFVRLVNAFVRGGVLRMPDGPGAITELAHACWVVAEFWLPFAELGGAHVDDEISRKAYGSCGESCSPTGEVRIDEPIYHADDGHAARGYSRRLHRPLRGAPGTL